MMTTKWETIIESLMTIKPECRDKEYLIKTLDTYYDYGIEFLDNLFLMGILTNEEYIKYTKKVQETQKDTLQSIQDRIDKATNNPDTFTPLTYYCCCRPPAGAGIDRAANDEWIASMGDKSNA